MFIWDDGDLNKEQEAAILEPESVLLIACPGSGKTRTLIYKIAFELSKIESSKQFVIAITYTNTAADEIKERIENLGVNTDQLWIGTIHSFCLEWILRPYSLYLPELKYGFRILNSYDSEELLTILCQPYAQQRITYWDCGFLATPQGFELTCLDTRKHPIIRIILKSYFQILESQNQIDFEQILYFSYKLLIEKPIINSILSKLFAIILVDEYQDTKLIQYHIITSILKSNSGKTKTLIVGDPNQSIYDSLGGFPMSKENLEILISFPLIEYSLSNNYRSSTTIIDYFDNYKTFETPIVPVGRDKDYESIITFNNRVLIDDLEDEIVKLIIYNITEKHISPNEICVAAPQWVHLAGLTRNLMIKLPDYSFDGPGMAPFSRDIENFWYKLSRIVLTEPSPHLYLKRMRWAKEILDDLRHIGFNVENMGSKRFLKICNSISINEVNGLEYLTKFFSELCLRLSLEISIYQSLREHYDSFFASAKRRIERVEKEGGAFIGTIENFRKVFKQKDGIRISTIHGVKGNEFDSVIAFGLLEGYVPHLRDPNGDANAKKILYVLCSRARKNLHLISEKERYNTWRPPQEYMPTTQLAKYDYDYSEELD